jgi:cephalosporin hydroxylase
MLTMKESRFKGQDVAADVREKYGFDGDILRLFSEHDGHVVWKWHHYIPLYDRYFHEFRGTQVRFLEIGVFQGGSLELWRKYFGPDARICGIDIDPKCAALDGQAGMVRIGSQDDPEFLRSVVEELGGIDVVLDDGSHVMDHLRTTLSVLFPLLSDGGVYMIEDLHTAYHPGFGGGTGNQNFFRHVRKLTDDMHHWYHSMPAHVPELQGMLTGIHVHDSIAVFDKGRVYPPVHSQIGG